MNNAAAQPFLPQSGFALFRAHDQFGTGENPSHRFHFILDKRGARIRNAQHQRGSKGLRCFPMAKRINACAGRVGNCEGIDDVSLPIEERVKRQVVQHPVRNDDQMFGVQTLAQRSKQLLI